jgi:predicted patatin/cPLA2 family phospholipase
MALHPVTDLLHARAAARSQPGARADGARLALVVEGGGMRGVVSSAMTQALEQAGLTPCFDLVVGCSAGALNAAALLAGVATGCTTEYAGAFASRRFINPARLLLGRPAVDVEYVLDHAGEHLDAERHARTLASPIPLHCLATAVDSAQGEDLTGLKDLKELRHALLASSRLPWVGGGPVEFRGRQYLDGGLVEAIPLRTALRLGATHALVLQTRPEGLRYPASEGFAERIVERRLRALNPALVECYRARGRRYDEASDQVQELERQRGAGPSVLGLRLPVGTPPVSRLERRAHVLRVAARVALEHTRVKLQLV